MTTVLCFQNQLFADVLQNRCSKKFRNINRKKPTSESLFNKVAGLKAPNFIKKSLQHKFFPVNIAKFLRTLFAAFAISMHLLHI